MAEQYVPLHQMRERQRGVIAAIGLQGSMLQRILDLGMTEGTPVTCRLRGPKGGLIACQVRGAVIALRADAAAKISIRLEETDDAPGAKTKR